MSESKGNQYFHDSLIRKTNLVLFGLLLIFLMVFRVETVINHRPTILRFFIVEKAYKFSPDLLVLLEGGSLLYSPTRERVDKIIELYKREPTPVLVCAAQQHKDDITKFLVTNGVEPRDLVTSGYTYGDRVGTYNNVLEMVRVLTTNKEYRFLDIVTSPYHERRVHIITSKLFAKSGLDVRVRVRFSHVNDSDIYHTNQARYLRMVGHEVLGIVGFYMQTLTNGFDGLSEAMNELPELR